MKQLYVFTVFFAALILVQGCIKTQDERGYLSRFAKFDQIIIGTSDKEYVYRLLGSPSTRSMLDEEAWFYISTKSETIAFATPDIVEQDIHKITFNKEGVVTKLENLTEMDAREIEFADDVTPTEGNDFTVLQQLLGNFGRFNNEATGSGSLSRGQNPGR
jgi:outer membrane protein assembly factor BamE (lipoprotein component of BamABCDE complex)